MQQCSPKIACQTLEHWRVAELHAGPGALTGEFPLHQHAIGSHLGIACIRVRARVRIVTASYRMHAAEQSRRV